MAWEFVFVAQTKYRDVQKIQLSGATLGPPPAQENDRGLGSLGGLFVLEPLPRGMSGVLCGFDRIAAINARLRSGSKAVLKEKARV